MWRFGKIITHRVFDVWLIILSCQSFRVIEKAVFRNCLVVMRPIMLKNELASVHDVEVHLHNEFSSYLENLKADFAVRMNVRCSIKNFHSRNLNRRHLGKFQSQRTAGGQRQ